VPSRPPKSLAARNDYDIEPNRELIALGAANIASGISPGFAVSGADSRTAKSDVTRGKTHMTSVYAAVLVAMVLMFLTRPVSMCRGAAFAAVLIAGIALFDLPATIRLYQKGRREFRVSNVAI
jgi:MFS superfamily sulfate permease-like transporter